MTNAQVWFALIAGAVILFTAVLMFAIAVGGGYDNNGLIENEHVNTITGTSTLHHDPSDPMNVTRWRGSSTT
jgi:hypothetical protein